MSDEPVDRELFHDEEETAEEVNERIREQINSEWNATVEQMEARIVELEAALRALVEEVEMGESVGICLPDRVPSLHAQEVLRG